MIRHMFQVYYNGEKNIVTPQVLKYRQRKFGDELLGIEISNGEILDKPIYGCTILIKNLKTDEVQICELSKSFENYNQVEDYIKSLDKVMVEETGRYGEIKVIR